MRRRWPTLAPKPEDEDVHGRRFNMAGELLTHDPKAPKASPRVTLRPFMPKDALLAMLEAAMGRERRAR